MALDSSFNDWRFANRHPIAIASLCTRLFEDLFAYDREALTYWMQSMAWRGYNGRKTGSGTRSERLLSGNPIEVDKFNEEIQSQCEGARKDVDDLRASDKLTLDCPADRLPFPTQPGGNYLLRMATKR